MTWHFPSSSSSRFVFAAFLYCFLFLQTINIPSNLMFSSVINLYIPPFPIWAMERTWPSESLRSGFRSHLCWIHFMWSLEYYLTFWIEWVLSVKWDQLHRSHGFIGSTLSATYRMVPNFSCHSTDDYLIFFACPNLFFPRISFIPPKAPHVSVSNTISETCLKEFCFSLKDSLSLRHFLSIVLKRLPLDLPIQSRTSSGETSSGCVHLS